MVVEKVKVQKEGLLEERKRISKFLDKFAIKDSKNISDKKHGDLMIWHFYYVDHNEQGYHVPYNIWGDTLETASKVTKVEEFTFDIIYDNAVRH